MFQTCRRLLPSGATNIRSAATPCIRYRSYNVRASSLLRPHNTRSHLFERARCYSTWGDGKRPDQIHFSNGGMNRFTRFKTGIRMILKKSTKPFNTDDISAFISWIVVSHVILFIISTTTFFSVIIYLLNTVSAQEYLAKKIGKLLTRNNPELSVIFENAIVPNWSSSKIRFNKVFVSRRPNLSNTSEFVKGSQKDAMQRATLALSENVLVNNNDFNDGNYTQLDLTIDQIEISLSFTKWLNGRGILDEVVVSGIRGVIDRTHIKWDPALDPALYKNVHKPGDFEISQFIMNDALVTVYQPSGFRPFNISIINCNLPRLRKNWLLYDILNANNINGAYDNSMFTLHKKLNANSSSLLTRIRIDNLDIDHLNANDQGPFGWITEGTVNMLADIELPNQDTDGLQFKDIVQEFKRKLSNKKLEEEQTIPNKFAMEFFLKLNNVKAEVPLFTRELTYKNNALIRPIVGYMNSKRTYIPIRCRVIKDIKDFEGAWTVYDSHLMYDLSSKVYDAFATYVADEERRSIRVRRVTFWSLQLFLQMILMGLATIT
ncbi:hypothetical protein KAFR_0B06870 [Kazachstania africana CBS 2517]|uniref:Mitochondrial distribution and morphology protein 31 n=1 Tax=Kazachstania africana (strain ATCC 22294 / BCRC 22015 / CBS 2517 / CECT 1963 / NBRC 1671 / NRRL Y-8276) TaxID=1071382 RepID=H2ARI4_KAZAF|nr:hypothetical protein KAFR_0B06870 [Kazachstania africana CBS 2517]CCF56984.1 hypothetical protein KAFR_0B06870 [Kazachstania africana CBS 2517]